MVHDSFIKQVMGLEKSKSLQEIISSQWSSQNGSTVSLGWHSSWISNTPQQPCASRDCCLMLGLARGVSALAQGRDGWGLLEWHSKQTRVAWHPQRGCRCPFHSELLCTSAIRKWIVLRKFRKRFLQNEEKSNSLFRWEHSSIFTS